MFDLATLTSRLLGSEKVIVEVQDLRRSNEHLSQSTSLWLVFQTAGRKVYRLCQHSMVSPAATLCGDDHSKLLLVLVLLFVVLVVSVALILLILLQ